MMICKFQSHPDLTCQPLVDSTLPCHCFLAPSLDTVHETDNGGWSSGRAEKGIHKVMVPEVGSKTVFRDDANVFSWQD